MKPIWIELVNTGVANRFEFDNYELIEMNWRLTGYPKLYKDVFQHELKHGEGKYKFKDFFHDMGSRTPGLLNFMAHHISSWTQLLPFYWDVKRKQIVYDWSSIIGWGMIVTIAGLIYYALRWMP
jgi:hypothetical protein